MIIIIIMIIMIIIIIIIKTGTSYDVPFSNITVCGKLSIELGKTQLDEDSGALLICLSIFNTC